MGRPVRDLFTLADSGVIRVRELLELVNVQVANEQGRLMSVFDRACHVLGRDEGKDLRQFWGSIRVICDSSISTSPDDAAVALLLKATWKVLWEQETTSALPHFDPTIRADEFERRVNEIMADERVAYRLRSGSWILSGVDEAEVLRRILLRGDDEIAGCRQGDLQVEMVVSTIQDRLRSPGAVLVDYGAGLGRVLAGLAQADRFRMARYVAVDEPIPEDVRALASTTGASASFIGRDEFLTSDVRADVIMVVNTLHHIPFSDIPRQLFGLFAALREGGVVLVHEMGELRHPEQMNVPWRAEDLWKLFDGPRFTMNPRTTQSRSGVPLSNVLVEARGSLSEYRDALDANARTVWMQIKRRVLDDVRRLYGSRDEHAHAELQHALIINANLDLNPPREWNDAVHQHGHHR